MIIEPDERRCLLWLLLLMLMFLQLLLLFVGFPPRWFNQASLDRNSPPEFQLQYG